MFKLNEITSTKGGHTARIISIDADVKPMAGSKTCNIVAVITVGTAQYIYSYDENGKLSGAGHTTYDLISNEPNAEEAELISQIRNLSEGGLRDGDESLLKIIRQLRKKS